MGDQIFSKILALQPTVHSRLDKMQMLVTVNFCWPCEISNIEYSFVAGELFAQGQLDGYPGLALEKVLDSSRYFVLRIEDSGKCNHLIFFGANMLLYLAKGVKLLNVSNI